MQSVLKELGYLPCRRMGLNRPLSVFITFLLSGIIHCIGLIPLGVELFKFNMMLLFFIVQPVFIGLETVFEWNPSNLRTLILLASSTTLFIFPFLTAVGLD